MRSSAAACVRSTRSATSRRSVRPAIARGAQQAQHREAGRVRRRAVVVGARALRERLAVGGREEEVALAGVEEARRDRVGERERAREEALARARAVQVEVRLEQRGVIVEEREHVRAALVPDPQQPALRVDELRGEEVRRGGRVGEHRRVAEQRCPRARAPRSHSAFHAVTRLRSVPGAIARAARGEQLLALGRELRARLARAVHQHGGAVLEVAALGDASRRRRTPRRRRRARASTDAGVQT